MSDDHIAKLQRLHELESRIEIELTEYLMAHVYLPGAPDTIEYGRESAASIIDRATARVRRDMLGR